MGTIVDCRGLACPQPVIQSKKAMAESEQATTIVDNETAVQNVSRMADKEGYAVTVERKADGIYLSLSKSQPGGQTMPTASPAPSEAQGATVLLIASDSVGRGDDELGGILIRSFLHTLNEVEPLPGTIVFLNAGVKLTMEGSSVLEDLASLTEKGVQILACGTCLGHFGLKGKVAVGEVSNMYTIAETLLGAGKVVAV
jgi:selenium metabolism protein YedF